MARNSWGSTRKLPSGRIQARYLGPDGKTYKAPNTFPDKLSALAWLGDVRKTIDLGSWEPPALKKVKVAVPTVGEAVEHWLSVMKAGVRDSTYATYSAIVTNRVLNDDALCAVPVDRLTVAMVGEWWERTITRWPDTAPRNRSAYQKLRAAIALAVEYGHIDHNVVNLRAARRQVKPKAKELPDTADMLSILNTVPHRFRLVTVLCLFHGLRLGEALGIRGANISPECDTITVEGNLVRIQDEDGHSTMVHHEPKTQAGYRTVPVLSEFVHVVREHVDTYKPGAGCYATTTATGGPVMDTVYRNIFHAAQDRAGVTARITPHYGRNWLITRLAEAVATPREIGRVLGQEDVSTIVGVYTRPTTNKSGRASVPSLLHPLGHRPLKPMALFVTG